MKRNLLLVFLTTLALAFHANAQEHGQYGLYSSSFGLEKPEFKLHDTRPNAGLGLNKVSENSSVSATSPSWGIGIRGGDPLGLTVKKYLGNDRAFEFIIGRTNIWGRSYNYRYYYDRYDDWRNYDFQRYSLRSAISLQGRYLFHKDLDVLDGLKWYYGPGVQMRVFSVDYHYRYRNHNNSAWIYDYQRASFVNLGLDGILGLEYTFDDLPISLFLEVNLYLELFRSTFWIMPQSGIGARFNF